jgi:hypothetical protein
MPTITAQAIISKAQTILQDTTGIRWPTTELLGWINDGQREIVMLRPDAYTKISTFALTAGTKQAIPSDGVMLIEVIRNMGTNGTTPSGAIRKVPRQILDGQVPGWHSATAAATVQHYTVEDRAPKNFYVYPPSLGTTQVEVLYSAAPPDVASASNVISVDDIYSTVLLDYLMYRAYSKDTEYAGNADRAALARKAFENAMGLKAAADAANAAKANVKG